MFFRLDASPQIGGLPADGLPQTTCAASKKAAGPEARIVDALSRLWIRQFDHEFYEHIRRVKLAGKFGFSQALAQNQFEPVAGAPAIFRSLK